MMDLDDWEYLPDAAAYLLLRPNSDAVDDEALTATIPVRSPSVFNMDYFSTTDSLPPPRNLQFVPIQFPSPSLSADDVVKRLLHDTNRQQEEEEEEEEAVNINNNNTTPDATASSKVFFKNSFSKEPVESVDMKFLDSSPPVSSFSIGDSTTTTATVTSPRKRSVFDDLFNDDEISRNLTLIKSKSDADEVAKSDVNWIGEGIIGDDYGTDADGIVSGLNLWKLGFGGIGAICSFGVAAATICLIFFGNNHKAKQNHKLRFQIYGTDDQRMKQVVQQATKFNEAMSAAVRGVPLNRAHITYGGYYDNAL